MNLSAIQKLIYVGPVFNKIAINQIPVSGNQMVNCLIFVEPLCVVVRLSEIPNTHHLSLV